MIYSLGQQKKMMDMLGLDTTAIDGMIEYFEGHLGHQPKIL